ncbi:hypothetical protein NL676_018548 [Syzygium grande]|nr:hypothetical protein NL676_018548 [Syzygium grande]
MDIALFSPSSLFADPDDSSSEEQHESETPQSYAERTHPFPGKDLVIREFSFHQLNANLLWPGTFAFAEWLVQHRTWIEGRHIIELGSGTGALAIFLQKSFSLDITMSDYDDLEIEENIEHNCKINGITPVLPHIKHSWGDTFPLVSHIGTWSLLVTFCYMHPRVRKNPKPNPPNERRDTSSAKPLTHCTLAGAQPLSPTLVWCLNVFAPTMSIKPGDCNLTWSSTPFDPATPTYTIASSTCTRGKLFDEIRERDKICWTTMIVGYSQSSREEDALLLFCRMLSTNVQPDGFTISSVVSSCAKLAFLCLGQAVHAKAILVGVDDLLVSTALVDMYSNCGVIADARFIFNRMTSRNVVSWNAMIGGYAQNGQDLEALRLYEEMLQGNMKPDIITFIAVLSSCVLAYLMEQGQKYFDSISKVMGLCQLWIIMHSWSASLFDQAREIKH